MYLGDDKTLRKSTNISPLEKFESGPNVIKTDQIPPAKNQENQLISLKPSKGKFTKVRKKLKLVGY